MNDSASRVYLVAGQDEIGLEDVAEVFPALGIPVNTGSAVRALYLVLLWHRSCAQVMCMPKDAL